LGGDRAAAVNVDRTAVAAGAAAFAYRNTDRAADPSAERNGVAPDATATTEALCHDPMRPISLRANRSGPADNVDARTTATRSALRAEGKTCEGSDIDDISPTAAAATEALGEYRAGIHTGGRQVA
jgi:hypothetical protein